jgi:putative redox protein
LQLHNGKLNSKLTLGNGGQHSETFAPICHLEESEMVAVRIDYEGDLHCTAVHGPSGTALTTDAPKDNHGREESFSPTDLVAAALGTCMLTVMGLTARHLKLDMSGATAHVEKAMASAPVRRIETLTVKIHVPLVLSDDQKRKLEAAAHSCPVHKSLHPDVAMPIEFRWG